MRDRAERARAGERTETERYRERSERAQGRKRVCEREGAHSQPIMVLRERDARERAEDETEKREEMERKSERQCA